MYQEYLKNFLQDVHDECKDGYCCDCLYYDDNVGTCMFSEDPEDWDLEMIINAYYSKDIKSADEKPLSAVAEHIKNRLYETALNTNETVASDTIAAMAERIDFWISELKDGD